MPRHPAGRPAGRLVVAGVLGLVVLLVVAILVWRSRQPDSRLEEALAQAPPEAERLSWTDWAAVRRELGADVGAEASPEEVAGLVEEAFSSDLSPMSALLSSASGMQEHFGFSPATLEWELFAQSGDRAVDLLKVTEGTDLEALGDTLEELGWTRPEDDDGVWTGGPEVLAGVDSGLTPELQHFVIRADDDLVLVSDQAASLETLADERGTDAYDDVAGELGDAVAAALYSGDYACEHLAMAQADEDAVAEADVLLAEAGEVHPLTAFAIGRRPGDAVRVVMEVEDADDAEADARTRARLANGPAPGQGGDFGDRFELVEAASQGRLVLLDLKAVEGSYVLSDLSNGPVLFATC